MSHGETVLLQLDDAFYEAKGVMPFSRFSTEKQAEIGAACERDSPPPRWLNFELCTMESRAWFEWFWRRGRAPARERISVELREAVIKKHGMTCWLCGDAITDRGDLHLDHVIPHSKGGPATAGNLRPAHAFCNASRGNKEVV